MDPTTQSFCPRCGVAAGASCAPPNLLEKYATLSAPELQSMCHLLSSNEAPLSAEMPTIQPVIQRVLSAQHDYIGHLNTEIQELRIATERRIQELEITKQSVKDHAGPAARYSPLSVACLQRFCAKSLHGRCHTRGRLRAAPWRSHRGGSAISAGAGGKLRSIPSYMVIHHALHGTVVEHGGACPPLSVETQLHRSGNTPFDVTLMCGVFGQLEPSTSFSPLADRMPPPASFNCGANARPPANSEGQPSEIAQLESMSTSFDLADVFSIAPSLRELIIPSETDYGGSWHAKAAPLVPYHALPWAL
ncbi:hypothetical protein B0H13DRAFT_1886391 [Mycena leptocephala]|nr:hypothetical protein B0H13DRAFT_1886391 [Mycena leptocephala]